MAPTKQLTLGLLDWLGSLKLAIGLLLLLGVICGAATFYESSHGTPAVQGAVYRTAWFAALLTLLGLNVAVSLGRRYPWKLHQTGFVMAHVGVLALLLGSLVTLQFGMDGQMALYEGESARSIETESRTPIGLPFDVTLLDFHSDRYPGSTMAATYESRVRVDDPERGVFEQRISMNEPLHYRGYVFFQASFVEGRPMMSIFSVARAPGLPIVYLGTTLLCLGVAWMFYVNPAIARRRAARALRERAVSRPRLSAATALLAVLALPSLLQAGPDVDPLRAIAVQDGGRLKPLDSFARETARRVGGARVFGAESIAGQQPLEWLVSMMADPDRWKQVPMIRVTQAELRSSLHLPAERDRFSFAELVANERFTEAVQRLDARAGGSKESKLTPGEQALSGLYETLSLVAAILAGEEPRLLPSANPNAAWTSLAQAQKTGSERRAVLLTSAFLAAYRDGDTEGTRVAASALASRLSHMSPAVQPSAAQLDREVRYNQMKPFRLAWLLYLGAAAFLLARLTFAARSRWALAPVLLAFGVHTYGLALRTMIAGRPPVTNMYESVVFVAWGAVLLALILEWSQRSGYAAISASILAIACLVIADSVPIMDGAIGPLVPVLRDNFWLTTHVLTISLGYAALMLATGIAHVVLALWFAKRLGGSAVPRLLYRSLQAGTLLLAAGTLLGGVWASYAWGRFWGWDPKETWALIALIGYLALLHARSAGLLREFGLAVGSVAAFLGVLMAWYGVNFILGTGLHSYGFGAGGAGYVGGFALAELLLAGAALLVWRRRNASPSVVAPCAAVPVRG